MKLPRRQFLHLAAGAAGLPVVSQIATAQAYPSRPVRLVVGFAAGGTRMSSRASWARGCRSGSASDRDREPCGCRQRYRGRGGDQIAARRVYAVHGRPKQRDQRVALRQAQFRFRARLRAGRGHLARAQRDGDAPLGSGQDRPRVHRLRQGQSRQDQHGLGGQRNVRPCVRRIVQDDDRHQHGARALSRRRAGADRSARRTGAGDVRQPAVLDRAYQGRQAARARGDDSDPVGGAAGCLDGGRIRAGL